MFELTNMSILLFLSQHIPYMVGRNNVLNCEKHATNKKLEEDKMDQMLNLLKNIKPPSRNFNKTNSGEISHFSTISIGSINCKISPIIHNGRMISQLVTLQKELMKILP